MPTLADFLVFIRDVMGITTSQLPDASPNIGYAFNTAMDTVNPDMSIISTISYSQAVNNLAGDFLLNWCPDQAGQTFFADARTVYKLNSFVAGVVQSAGDEGTNEALLVPDALKDLMLADLQNLKTPYGRRYLQIAQSTGTLWGVS